MPTINEWNYIIAAYAAVWVGFIVYYIRLARLSRRAEEAYHAARGHSGSPGRVV